MDGRSNQDPSASVVRLLEQLPGLVSRLHYRVLLHSPILTLKPSPHLAVSAYLIFTGPSKVITLPSSEIDAQQNIKTTEIHIGDVYELCVFL